MDRIIPSDCDVRIRIEGEARWRRVSRFTVEDKDKEYNPLSDAVYLEVDSQSQHPVVIDLVSQRIRLLVFPGRFVVTKLGDEDAVVPKGDVRKNVVDWPMRDRTESQ